MGGFGVERLRYRLLLKALSISVALVSLIEVAYYKRADCLDRKVQGPLLNCSKAEKNRSNLKCLSRGSNRTAASHMGMKHSRVVNVVSDDGSMKAVLENAKILYKSFQMATYP